MIYLTLIIIYIISLGFNIQHEINKSEDRKYHIIIAVLIILILSPIRLFFMLGVFLNILYNNTNPNSEN
jgi:hypothetical protein